MRRVASVIVVLACLGPLRQATAQDTHIRGFTDVTFNASDRAGTPTNFALGQFDLYGRFWAKRYSSSTMTSWWMSSVS